MRVCLKKDDNTILKHTDNFVSSYKNLQYFIISFRVNLQYFTISLCVCDKSNHHLCLFKVEDNSYGKVYESTSKLL